MDGDGVPPSEEVSLSGFVTRWDVTLPALAKRCPDGTPLSVAPAPFSVLLELRLGDHVPHSAGQVVDLLATAVPRNLRIDKDRSTVLAGVEHVIMPGHGPTRAVGLVHRRPDLDALQFLRHWSEKHIHVARRMPGAWGYRQLRADRLLTRLVAEQMDLMDHGFDGAGQVFFESTGEMAAGRATPEVARDATEDELRFIDHSRSHFFAARLCPGNPRFHSPDGR
jgi:hypothetical protein